MEITFIYTLELTIYSFINPVRVNNELFGARIFFLLKQRMLCMNRGNLFNLFYHFRTLQSSRMINYREEEKRILDEILGKGVYDNRIRPSGTNGTGYIYFLLLKNGINLSVSYSH